MRQSNTDHSGIQVEEHSSQSKPSDHAGQENLRQNDGLNEPPGSSQSHVSSPFTEQYDAGAKPSPSHVITAYHTQGPTSGGHFDSSEPIMAEVVHHPGDRRQRMQQPPERDIMWPVILFVATCFTTYGANGPLYAAAVMFILTAHEFGHFFQTVRYKIPASFPMFIPMPFPPLGTMGAVIGMAPHEGDRKALFDVAVSGPIAGLIPTLICCVWGLQLSEVLPLQAIPQDQATQFFGAPLLFQWMSEWIIGPIPDTHFLRLHPIAFAGWVGLLITALNLFPVGQLDGGHTLYALLGRKAHGVARAIWIGCLVYVVLSENWGWSLMLALVWFMGTAHPPTADDTVPLGLGRKILGWTLLMFLPIGFTPTPFVFPDLQDLQRQQQEQQQEESPVVNSDLNDKPIPAERQTGGLLATDHNLSDHRTDKQQRDTTNQHQNLQGHQITHLKKEPNWNCGRHSLPENQLAGLR